ncbi:unnamed protein product, partial [Ectocarpus sp. 13 AM-2016]
RGKGIRSCVDCAQHDHHGSDSLLPCPRLPHRHLPARASSRRVAGGELNGLARRIHRTEVEANVGAWRVLGPFGRQGDGDHGGTGSWSAGNRSYCSCGTNGGARRASHRGVHCLPLQDSKRRRRFLRPRLPRLQGHSQHSKQSED